MFPEDTNTRAKDMWRFISREVDFRKKYVLDIGCGHGEMLWRSIIAGAIRVKAIDKEIQQSVLDIAKIDNHIAVYNIHIEDMSTPVVADIVLCLSVLPYLDDPYSLLEALAEDVPLSIIECQYAPEPYNIDISDDVEMRDLLFRCGFSKVENIGATKVEIRSAHRTIWLCHQKTEQPELVLTAEDVEKISLPLIGTTT